MTALLRVVPARQVPPQPWRNGGGLTRELLAWPEAADWRLRISLAEVDRDGSFSVFPGARRHFAVVDGRGLSLRWAPWSPWQDVRPGDPPLRFAGEQAPECRLLPPTPSTLFPHSADLNLMTRGPLQGQMLAMQPHQAQHFRAPCRGFFCWSPGRWRRGAEPARDVAAQTLVWLQDDEAEGGGPGGIEAWHFQPDAQDPREAQGLPCGWWLSAAPAP